MEKSVAILSPQVRLNYVIIVAFIVTVKFDIIAFKMLQNIQSSYHLKILVLLFGITPPGLQRDFTKHLLGGMVISSMKGKDKLSFSLLLLQPQHAIVAVCFALSRMGTVSHVVILISTQPCDTHTHTHTQQLIP